MQIFSMWDLQITESLGWDACQLMFHESIQSVLLFHRKLKFIWWWYGYNRCENTLQHRIKNMISTVKNCKSYIFSIIARIPKLLTLCHIVIIHCSCLRIFGKEFFLQLDQYSATSLENEELVSISFEGSSYSTSFPSLTSKKLWDNRGRTRESSGIYVEKRENRTSN